MLLQYGAILQKEINSRVLKFQGSNSKFQFQEAFRNRALDLGIWDLDLGSFIENDYSTFGKYKLH